MDEHAVNARWQEIMKKYTPANKSAIDDAKELTQYFYLGADVTAS